MSTRSAVGRRFGHVLAPDFSLENIKTPCLIEMPTGPLPGRRPVQVAWRIGSQATTIHTLLIANLIYLPAFLNPSLA